MGKHISPQYCTFEGRASKYTEQNPREMNRGANESTIMVGNFNSLSQELVELQERQWARPQHCQSPGVIDS